MGGLFKIKQAWFEFKVFRDVKWSTMIKEIVELVKVLKRFRVNIYSEYITLLFEITNTDYRW